MCWTAGCGPTWQIAEKPVRGPKGIKNASFCRMEPLEWRFGVHKAPVKGPPCNAENETWMWSLNRLACGPEPAFKLVILGSLFASLILLETPIFYSFCSNFHFRCSKFGPNFRKNVWPLKTNLNKRRAVLWSLNRHSEWDPESSRKKETKTHQKTIATRNPTLLSAERSVFVKKEEKWIVFFWLWAVGLFSVAKDL